jgi:hypothetical protein
MLEGGNVTSGDGPPGQPSRPPGRGRTPGRAPAVEGEGEVGGRRWQPPGEFVRDGAPTFFYEFDDRNAPPLSNNIPPGYQDGAGHAEELAYMWPSFTNGLSFYAELTAPRRLRECGPPCRPRPTCLASAAKVTPADCPGRAAGTAGGDSSPSPECLVDPARHSDTIVTV